MLWKALKHYVQLHNTTVCHCGHTGGVGERTGGDKTGTTLDICVSSWGSIDQLLRVNIDYTIMHTHPLPSILFHPSPCLYHLCPVNLDC